MDKYDRSLKFIKITLGVVLIIGLFACGAIDQQGKDIDFNKTLPQDAVTIGPKTRPAKLILAEDPGQRPLLLVLHGYGMNSSSIDAFFKASRTAQELNYYTILPQGRTAETGVTYWSATDACCDFFGPDNSDVDLKYLLSLVNETMANYPVAKDQIYVIGFSNGGFMANRLACDATEVFAGVISFAGANFKNLERCKPSRAINYLQVHGTSDPVIAYDGGLISKTSYPSAFETTDFWAKANDCQLETFTPGALELSFYNVDLYVEVPTIDELLSFADPGNETDELNYSQCRSETNVGLWTMNKLGHAPLFIDGVLKMALRFVTKDQ